MLEHRMGDGLHEVRLAQPGGAVYEKWIVGASWSGSHGMRRRCGQLIGLADYEGPEGIPLIEGPGGSTARGIVARRGRSHKEIHLWPLGPLFLYLEYHV